MAGLVKEVKKRKHMSEAAPRKEELIWSFKPKDFPVFTRSKEIFLEHQANSSLNDILKQHPDLARQIGFLQNSETGKLEVFTRKYVAKKQTYECKQLAPGEVIKYLQNEELCLYFVSAVDKKFKLWTPKDHLPLIRSFFPGQPSEQASAVVSLQSSQDKKTVSGSPQMPPLEPASPVSTDRSFVSNLGNSLSTMLNKTLSGKVDPSQAQPQTLLTIEIKPTSL